MLDVSHQQMEEYRDQPSHAEKIAYQQKLLQEDVVHIRAEISQVSTVRPTWLIKLKICTALLLRQCSSICLSAKYLYSIKLETGSLLFLAVPFWFREPAQNDSDRLRLSKWVSGGRTCAHRKKNECASLTVVWYSKYLLFESEVRFTKLFIEINTIWQLSFE